MLFLVKVLNSDTKIIYFFCFVKYFIKKNNKYVLILPNIYIRYEDNFNRESNKIYC